MAALVLGPRCTAGSAQSGLIERSTLSVPEPSIGSSGARTKWMSTALHVNQCVQGAIDLMKALDKSKSSAASIGQTQT